MRTMFCVLFVAMVSCGLANDVVAQLLRRAQPPRVPAQRVAEERTQQPSLAPTQSATEERAQRPVRTQAENSTPIDLTAEKTELEQVRTELVGRMSGIGTRPTNTGIQAMRSIGARLETERQRIANATTREATRSIEGRLEVIERDIEREIAADRPRQEARDRQEELDRIARQEREELAVANKALLDFRTHLVGEPMRYLSHPPYRQEGQQIVTAIDRLRGPQVSTIEKRNGLIIQEERLKDLLDRQEYWNSPEQVRKREQDRLAKARQAELDRIDQINRDTARRAAAAEVYRTIQPTIQRALRNIRF